MDYYSTLGLQRGATDADIKKAYRSMAMKHHPDRGGDEKKFKEISQAYEFLSDPQKRQMIDQGVDPNNPNSGFGQGGNPFEFHFNSGNFNDIFNGFGFGFQNHRPQRRNKSLNINVEITLEDVLTGKDLNAEVNLPGGKRKLVNIAIPTGIEHGQQIKYSDMGDDSIPNLPPGDLIVNVFVKSHHTFRRDGDTLILDRTISVWDAILGTAIDVNTLDNKRLSVNIPPGTQSETVFNCRQEGLPNIRHKQRGNLLIRLKIEIPKNLSIAQLQKIEQLKNTL